LNNFGTYRLGLIAAELYASAGIDIVEFSTFVRDRAWTLLGATWYRVPIGDCEQVLEAIDRAGDGFNDAVYLAGGWYPIKEKLDYQLDRERAWQGLLLAESITDDQSAIDYIERVLPGVEALANQWELSGLRHAEERDRLTHEKRIKVGYRESKWRVWESEADLIDGIAAFALSRKANIQKTNDSA
jgi:hypothetical protein